MTNNTQPPVTGYFEGERLELVWRYVYQPEFLPLLMAYLGVRSGMHILDVGCGSGFFTRLLAQTVADSRVVGLDSDEKLLGFGEQMLVDSGLTNVELRPGNAYQIPFSDETFDLVTSQTLLCILGDPAQALCEKVRVVRPGGTVSAIACFCRSGGLPHYNGRYPLTGNYHLDQLDLKLDRAFRQTVRPRLLEADHNILNLDLLWQFKAVGLQDIQINGHLALISPGDTRIPLEEGATYALARQRKELEWLTRMREEYGPELAKDGFSPAEFEDLIAMKRARYDYLQADPSRVREVMEVFTQSLLIIRGTKPNTINSE